jgi:hypothetical protein
MRVLITGGPKTGKTTLSTTYDCPVRHTDDLIELDWSDQSDQVAGWLDDPGPWVIEGVAVVRGLRKWLRAHEQGLPFDHLIYLTKPLTAQTQGQSTMGTATRTIWCQIAPVMDIRAAGHPITIEYR